uniref:Coatomer subunit epsilon-1 n=1 Tax=Zea mays TaxID=4577 RepID=A0A804N4Y6_MAIZE
MRTFMERVCVENRRPSPRRVWSPAATRCGESEAMHEDIHSLRRHGRLLVAVSPEAAMHLSKDKQLKSHPPKNVESEILREHIKKEREAAKAGKRPYYLKKYRACLSVFVQLVISEIDSSAATSLQVVKLLALYLTGDKEGAISSLKEWLSDSAIGSNPVLRLIAGIIFMHEQDYNEALKHTHSGGTLDLKNRYCKEAKACTSDPLKHPATVLQAQPPRKFTFRRGKVLNPEESSGSTPK